MTQTRYLHTATTLPDGTVLITGGYQLSSAELFSPIGGTNAPVGSMHSARYAHSAVLLQNGTVLVAGGCNGSGSCLASAEIYNPSTGAFVVTGSMSTPRWYFTMTLLQNGMVLIAGGCNGSNGCDSSAELYNPTTGTFNLTGSMSTRRWAHTATLLNNGNVLMTGGCNGSGSCLSSAEVYNTMAGNFSATGSMSVPRYYQTAEILTSGKVLVAGGCNGSNGCFSTAELYNPATGTFALTGSMSTKRWHFTATVLPDGTVLEVGGCNGSGSCLPSAEIYNPVAGTFSVTGNMNEPRWEQSAALLDDGTVLISGGCNGSNGCFSTQQIFHPEPPTNGFINPKYVIVAVVYSPPGSSSSVTYGTNTVLGNSTSLASSFASQVSQSISVGAVAGTKSKIFGFLSGITVTSSTALTQEEDTSSSVAVSQTTSESTTVNGSYSTAGVNHDYDYIFVWLNPVLAYSVYPSNPNSLTWGGYGFDMTDVPTIDLIGLQVGWLNGHIAMPSDVASEIARTWAAGQVWPAGQGPGFTSMDLATILAADPFSNPNYIVTPNVLTTTDGRFTATNNPTIAYETNIKTQYSDGYTTTAMQSQTAKYTYQQIFSIDQMFKGSLFDDTFTTDLKTQSTLTWMNQFSQATNNSEGQTASLSVTGPPVGYPGPAEFVVYQDNIYGTFMFYPKAQ